ncbi:MAG: PDZ domain-containing protein [Chthonomonadales bacterium]
MKQSGDAWPRRSAFAIGLITTLALYLNASPMVFAQHSELRREMDVARKKVYPALVNITVVSRYFQGGRALRAPAGGSGVIVSAAGHVLTNFHVAGHTTRITCTLPSGEAIEANVVTHDPLTDLSVLKLRLDKRKSHQPIPYAKLGNSDDLKVGDQVMAMGNPLMLSSSMTLGIVSNTKRVFTDFIGTEIEDQDLDTGERTGVFTRWIQHDALILPGNSGGPLVNLQGEVVGINELGGNGVGFAIPSNIAADVLRQAIAHGTVRRGWVGITVLPVDKLGRTTGALISSVMANSPAAKAGLKASDILLSISNRPVKVRFFEEVPLLYQQVSALQAGSTVQMRYDRDGAIKTATVAVTSMEKFNGDEDEVRDMGITVGEITGPLAIANRYPSKDGVLVTGMRAGYAFASGVPRVAPGDVILSVNGTPTNSVSTFRKAFQKRTPVYAISFRHNAENLIAIVKAPAELGQEEGGELPKAWLGVKVQVMTDELAKALGMAGKTGFRVTQVYPATEASSAGLKAGDVITSLNGNALEAHRQQDNDDLKRAIEDLSIGDKAELGLIRSGKPIKVSVKLQEPPSPVEKAKKLKQSEFEFGVRDITELDKFENRWPKTQTGVLVTDVVTGGWAAMAGLHSDDLILELNGASAANIDAFTKKMSALLKSKPRVVIFFVLRGAQTHFVFMEPDWAKLNAGR